MKQSTVKDKENEKYCKWKHIVDNDILLIVSPEKLKDVLNYFDLEKFDIVRLRELSQESDSFFIVKNPIKFYSINR